jgi:hypothetical protein
MQTETLGDAWAYSATVWIACAFGPYTKGMKRGRECVYRGKLDMETLVCTRGRDFPIARLAQRLRCPRCGSREVRVVWDFPAEPRLNAAAVWNG